MGFYTQYKGIQCIGAVLAKMEEDGIPIIIVNNILLGDGEAYLGAKLYATYTYGENDEVNIIYQN